MAKEKLEGFRDEEDNHHSVACDGSVDLSTGTGAGSAFRGSINDASDQEKALKQILGARESKAVWGFRYLVFAVLLVSMVLLAAMTYMYTTGAEQEEFQKSFDQDARKVLESLGASLDKALAGVDTFIVDILSYARATNQTWPFVTVPDFEARSGKFLALTKAKVFGLYLLVTPETRAEWELYTAKEGREWSAKSIQYLRQNNLFQDVYEARNLTEEFINTMYLDFVHDYSAWGVEDPKGLPETHPGPMLPLWQSAPLIPTTPIYNWDLATVAENESVLNAIKNHKVSISHAYMAGDGGDPAVAEENIAWADYFRDYIDPGEEAMEPLSDFNFPMVLDTLDWRDLGTRADYDPSEHKVAGILTQSVYWRDMIKGILPDSRNGVVTVFESPCSMSFTYEINGPAVRYLGGGDHHDSKYNSFVMSSLLQDLDEYNAGANKYSYLPLERDLCPWTVRVFPSQKYEDNYVSQLPVYFTLAVVSIFFFTTAVFVFYDWWVERRQRIVMRSAIASDAIVTSLFPSTVRDRLYDKETEEAKNKKGTAFLNKMDSHGDKIESSSPIADLFPEVTVLFADLVGFTAWSSTREPTQVFILLETLYGAFDKVAKRRGVFKVETIGDCYVAACGLPEPRRSHAVVLCQFAADVRDMMNSITKELEPTLGPGTGDLQVRQGLHSGAVTAGVLRMDKSRFQLFGDTVNTAARMESNGKPNRIQVSQKTADKLQEAGKGNWLTPRPDTIQAKGKGTMNTFWVEPLIGGTSTHTSALSNISSGSEELEKDAKKSMFGPSESLTSTSLGRLVEWNAKMLEELIKKVLGQRQAISRDEMPRDAITWQQSQSKSGCEVAIDPVAVQFRTVAATVDLESLVLDPKVNQQLHAYVAEIAGAYNARNAFHNFEHASHVAMSTNKLLIQMAANSNTSFGVAVDPFAQLAIVFSALIHDVDHRGVPNRVLCKEEPGMAKRYDGKSVAEQNSVDVAWKLLHRDSYYDLRACLFPTMEELSQFRKLVCNAVLAADLLDPELKRMRQDSWQEVFLAGAHHVDAGHFNRNATIVLEHVIQASDVIHTIQHWTTYLKWNQRLFEEMYRAYLSGRTDKDPSEGWYAGELLFFDNHIIPLAKKLKECQVFGPSGEQYLDAAYENRSEWEQKGEGIVQTQKMKVDSLCKIATYAEGRGGNSWSGEKSHTPMPLNDSSMDHVMDEIDI